MAQLNDLLSNISNIKNEIKQSIINKGQTVTNFASYPNAILNIQSGGSGDEGDIKLFETVEELNNDPDPSTDKLACVYTEGNLTNFYEYKTGLLNKNIVAFHSINDTIITVDWEYGNTYVNYNFDTPPLFEISVQKLFNITGVIINELSLTGTKRVLFYIDSNNNLKACVLFTADGQDRSEWLNCYYYDMDNNFQFKGLGTQSSNQAEATSYSLNIYNIDIENETFTFDKTIDNWSTTDSSNFAYNTTIDIASYLIGIYNYDEDKYEIMNELKAYWSLYFGFLNTSNNHFAAQNSYGLNDKLTYNMYNKYQPISLSMTADKEYVIENKFLGKSGVEEGILQNNINLTKDQIKIKTNIWNDISELTLDDSVTNLSNLYKNNTNIYSVPNIQGNNVIDAYSIFEGCTNLVNIGDLNFPNCTYFRSTFHKCSNLTYFPLKLENLKDDGNYRYLYGNCYNITENISNINISNSDCSNMFQQVQSEYISNINISNSDIRGIFNRMDKIIYMNNINFDNCSNTFSILDFSRTIINPHLKKIENITISNTVFAFNIFKNCINLIDVINLNLYNTTNISNTFANCYNLVNLSNLNITNVSNITNMFYNCLNLSNDSYASITNFLPDANQLTNQYISNIGLDINKFTNEQINILNVKGYVDAVILDDEPDETELG